MSLAQITDHTDRAVARLPSQFRESPVFVALMRAFAGPGQGVEDALWALLVLRDIINGTGATLDGIGDLVGQPRNGQLDDQYRRYILTRILVNRSTGVTRDLIRVTRAALAPETALRVQVDRQGIASAVVRVLEYVTPDVAADDLIAFLRDATKAGVRVLLETLVELEDTSFTFARAAFADGALTATDTEILVNSTAGFPTSGTLDVDIGLAEEEQVTYDGVTPTSFLNCSPLADDHDDRAVVSLAGAPGLGFGTTTDPDVGGALTEVRDGGA